MSELFIDGEDTVAVAAAEELKGHGGRAFLAVFCTAGGAEPALAAERNKLHFTAVGTGIHGSAEGRVAAVYHFINVVHFNSPGMECILDNFIIVVENLL